MRPFQPVGGATRAVLGVLFFVLFIGVWAVVTYGGIVTPLFLASPGKAVFSGVSLFLLYGFSFDVVMTVWRVLGGFAVAALVGVPLGLAMGAYKPIEAFFEPFISFARYLPASAFGCW